MYIGMYPLPWTSQVALVIKSPPANAGDIRDMGSIPGMGRYLGGGRGNLVHLPWRMAWSSCLENSMDRILWATVHRVTKTWT